MNKKVLSSACIGFILLAATVSLCHRTEDQRIPMNLTPSKILLNENEPIIDISQVKEQNETKIKNYHFLREDRHDEKEGSITKRSKPLHSLLEAETEKFSAMEKRKIESEEDKNSVLNEFSHEIRSNVGNKEFPISKRLSQILQNSKDMDFKSRPGFRSWGGKRVKFATWGGKRSKFSNWEGKQSPTTLHNDYPSSEEIDNVIDPMINPFRVDYDDMLTEEGRSGSLKKKDKFKSWGGKRNSAITYPALKTGYNAQNRFSNWKGKRINREDNMIVKRDLEYCESDDRDGSFIPEDELLKDTFSNKEFQTWRGKRMKEDLEHPSDSVLAKYPSSRGRSNLYSWVGKKSFDLETPVKRSDDMRMKQLLMKYFRSRRTLTEENSVLDRRNILRGKSLEDSGGLTKTGFSSWRGGLPVESP